MRAGVSLASVIAAAAAAAPLAASTVIAALDLSKPFATRSPWRFTAAQSSSIDDPIGLGGDTVPGAVSICLSKYAGGPCDPNLAADMRPDGPDDIFSQPHYLEDVRVVHPRGASGHALLVVQMSSLHSGDGDQRVLTQVLAYGAAADRFTRIYEHMTGRNNNQTVRYIDAGPLRGAMVSAEPTENAPYGYWITVTRLSPTYTYHQALRYRSATTYGDGNPLSVIDSEMANIEERLGLWRVGSPLPLPSGPCPKPRLSHMELWCR